MQRIETYEAVSADQDVCAMRNAIFFWYLHSVRFVDQDPLCVVFKGDRP